MWQLLLQMCQFLLVLLWMLSFNPLIWCYCCWRETLMWQLLLQLWQLLLCMCRCDSYCCWCCGVDISVVFCAADMLLLLLLTRDFDETLIVAAFVLFLVWHLLLMLLILSLKRCCWSCVNVVVVVVVITSKCFSLDDWCVHLCCDCEWRYKKVIVKQDYLLKIFY